MNDKNPTETHTITISKCNIFTYDVNKPLYIHSHNLHYKYLFIPSTINLSRIFIQTKYHHRN